MVTWKLEEYSKNQDGQWVLAGEDTATITTNHAQGSLHNELDWLQKLNRGYVDWTVSLTSPM